MSGFGLSYVPDADWPALTANKCNFFCISTASFAPCSRILHILSTLHAHVYIAHQIAYKAIVAVPKKSLDKQLTSTSERSESVLGNFCSPANVDIGGKAIQTAC